jgi:hypothetical protein
MIDQEYITMVFRAKDMPDGDISDLLRIQSCVYMSWGHIPYDYDKLKYSVDNAKELNHMNDQLCRQLTALERMASALDRLSGGQHD